MSYAAAQHRARRFEAKHSLLAIIFVFIFILLTITACTPAQSSQTAVALTNESIDNNLPPDETAVAIETQVMQQERTQTAAPQLTRLAELNPSPNATEQAQVRMAQMQQTATALAGTFAQATHTADDMTPTPESIIRPTMGAVVTRSAVRPTFVFVFTPSDSIPGRLRITYTVETGESLRDIATRYGITVTELQRYNNIRILTIEPGTQLLIPALITPLPVTPSPTPSDTPQPTATQTPPPSPTPDPDMVGVGDASVYPFYDGRLNTGQSMRVELKLIFDQWYITPTPDGLPTAVEANTDVERPTIVADPDVQQTPRPARAVDSVERVPPRLIAVLECPDGAFSGCRQWPARDVALIGTNEWDWVIRARDGISGEQDLTLRLYRASATDGDETISGTPLYSHPFTVDVAAASLTPAPAPDSGIAPAVVAGGVIALLLLMAGAVFMIVRRNPTPAAAPDPVAKPRPTAFISYRRKPGWMVARKIHDDLTAMGADIFIDLDDIHDGHFADYIESNILERRYFILVLAPGTLDSEWVRKEILLALKHDKPIIPVLVDGFDLYGSDVTDDIKGIQSHNAITISPEYVKAGIERIARFMELID